MDQIQYQILKFFLSILTRKMKRFFNFTMQTYINKFENRFTFKIKSGPYLEFFAPETTKILGSKKERKKSHNTPQLEITEVVLIPCNLLKNSFQSGSSVLYTFIPTKLFRELLGNLRTNFIFLKTFNSEFFLFEVLFTYISPRR